MAGTHTLYLVMRAGPSGWRRAVQARWGLMLLVAAMLGHPAAVAAAPPASASSALARAMQVDAIQDKFPDEVAPVRRKATETRGPVTEVPTKPARPLQQTPWGQLAGMLLWMTGFALAAIAAGWLRQFLPSWEIVEETPTPAPERQGGNGPATAPALTLADALAGEGRIADAVHLLLVRALALMAQRTNKQCPSSLTSRELLRRLSLSKLEQAALADLIGMVERVWFGRHEASPQVYDRCRGIFLQLEHGAGGRR